mgnify:CR=1 FL=1
MYSIYHRFLNSYPHATYLIVVIVYLYYPYMQKKKIRQPSSLHPFLKYSFLLIILISSGVFITTVKPLKLVGDVLQTIVGSEKNEDEKEKKEEKENKKKKSKNKSEQEEEKSNSESVLAQEPVVTVSEEIAESASIPVDFGYYDPSFFKKIASLLVTISLSASNPSIAAEKSSSVAVTAGITGRDLNYKELVLSLEYAKCNESSYIPLVKGKGDLRFADSVENTIFFSNEQSSVSVNETVSWVFPLTASKTANGMYCVRVKNDNPAINVEASSVVTILVQ